MSEELISQENFKDRQTLLIVFGILEIILGCITGFMALITMAVPFLPKVAGHETPALAMLLPGILLYAGLTAVFVWLGVGSILCRRWARTLLLLLGSYWLAIGLMTMVNMVFMLPVMSAHQPEMKQIPSEFRTAIMLFSFVFGSVVYVLLPAVIILFYKSPHVKATCEARDPSTSWTDACPLPVLALSLFALFSGITMAALVLSFHGIVPFFGIYITGFPAVVIMLIFSVAYIFASSACYKSQLRGWWTVVVAYGLSVISCTITFLSAGAYHMYELMRLPASQLATLKEMNVMQTPLMWIVATLFTLPFFAFLLYAKRYFPTAKSAQ